MSKQAVFSVLLIFLFALSLVAAGLFVTEQGLMDVSGRVEPQGAFRIIRDTDDHWRLIFAGTSWQLPSRPW
jgi:hypothetical protein